MQLTADGSQKFVWHRLPAQLRRIMRILPFLLLVAELSAYASGKAQSVTISGKDLSLKQVFNTIERQTGYVLFANKDVFTIAKKVTLNVTNMPLREAIDFTLKDQPIDYTIEGKTIVLSRKPQSYLMNVATPPPPVTGRVVDASGQPMSGVNILVKGTNKGTQTGTNGTFTISAGTGDILVISYVGYATREIAISGTNQFTPVNIVLTTSSASLSEAEVTISTGYQTISRERMTGSYATVQTRRLQNKLQPSLVSALEGMASGVVVTKDGKIEIRGRSTFLANAEPLIVVDGYPISGTLETINIDNIESMTVLKDAVAASIYGARSSNGVIVITTKTGRKGMLQLNYKGSSGVTLRPDLAYLNKTNSSDYVDAEIDAYKINPANAQNTYDRGATASRVTQLLIAKDRNQITEAQMNTELAQLRSNKGIDQLRRYLLRPKFTQQHNLSITAGNDKSMTNAAIRYIGNRNNTIDSSDYRVIFDLKNDWTPARTVTVRLFTNVNYASTTAPVRTPSEFYSYSSSSMLRPYSLIVDPATGQPQSVPVVRPQLISQYAAISGAKTMDYNPLNDLRLETTRRQNLQARLGASINVKLLEGLSAEAGGNWTRGSINSRTIYDATAFRVRALYNAATSITNPTKHYVPDGSIVDEYRNINEAYTFRGQLNFNRTFGSKHRITAIAGGEINKDVLDNNTYPTRFGYNDQAGAFSPFNYSDYNAGLYIADFQLPAGWVVANNGGYAFRDNRFVSMYANGSYEYDNRFILSSSARIDQANFFGTNPKYRYKPNWSVGGTYKLGQEKFFEVPWITRLNLRGSYGINGNISLKQGPYLLIQANGYSPTSGGIVYTIASPPNKDLRWERTQILNLGTDLTLFKGRLNATIDYYNKLSKDLLAPDFIDATYGRNSVTRNAGTARNTGIELSLETDVIKTKQFGWNVYFNGSYNTTKVLSFNYNYLYTSYLTMTSSASLFGGTGGTILKTGYPLDAIFSYPFAGLDNTGTPNYYNSAKTKTLGGNMKTADLVYSGTIRPKYVLALTNTFSYQRFDLSFMIIGQLGAVMRRDTYSGSNYENKYVAQRWRKAGDEATTIYPKLAPNSTDAWYFPYSDIMVQSANYAKLRDVTLTYRFNDKLWRHTGLNNIRIYFQGRNLWTVKANHDNIDPETMSIDDNGNTTRSLPLRPEFYGGLSINF